MTDRFKRAAALSAATVAVTAGALFGTVGSASAAPSHHATADHGRHCSISRGHWTRVWIPGHWQHRHWKPGHTQRIWHPGHRDCRR
ncbi:hypothetical protein [Streptomyces chiangmaiensis]|uniref:Secreted protein n=1 Tax=Streptomyces chiangmaiensis TaxID=766497 RepID=A0ABU7FBT8_9ACTN|nr:hypothetical protein [Streptomyces chiangmaiensis]MED7821579.1 hypothetical protein [Streptomyces chiangmaiensis]